jgi:hypothetical protein
VTAIISIADQQMEAGGLAAMLHDLLNVDLTGFHPRMVSSTPELEEQKLYSHDTLHRWWLDVLDRGFVWRSRHGISVFTQWEPFVATELLAHSYRQWCTDSRIGYPQHRTALGRFLNKFYRAHRPNDEHIVYEAESVSSLAAAGPVVWMKRPPGYTLDALAAARKTFADKLKLPVGVLPWAPKSDQNRL